MSIFFKGFKHVNTTNVAETVITLQSTEAEIKTLVKVRISKETNAALLKMFVDRENLFESDTGHHTGQATIEDFLEFDIARELQLGEEFALTLLNEAAGVHGQISGDLVYSVS